MEKRKKSKGREVIKNTKIIFLENGKIFAS